MELIKELLRKVIRLAWPRFLLKSYLWRPTGKRVDGMVVSLTTHGNRLGSVDAALMSILQGTMLPQRIVLCLNESVPGGAVGRRLARLQQFGVEIALVENLGPHTKYFHLVQEILQPGQCLVTADDDIYYRRDWLSELIDAHLRHPGDVICHWGKRIILDQHLILSYHDWAYIDTTDASPAHFALGVGGVLYPSSMVQAIKASGKGFVPLCPRADDIWLHYVALSSGHKIRQVHDHFRWPVHLPNTQASGLLHSNHLADGNDRQVAATYSAESIAKLRLHQRDLAIRRDYTELA